MIKSIFQTIGIVFFMIICVAIVLIASYLSYIIGLVFLIGVIGLIVYHIVRTLNKSVR